MGFDLLAPFRGRMRDASVRLSLRPLDKDWSISVPFRTTGAHGNSSKIAIHCHVFHVDLAQELFAKVALCPYPFWLFVTTDTPSKKANIAELLEGYEFLHTEIRLTPNRGRDVGPRFVACRDLFFDFDLLLFLHTKNTSHFSHKNEWRKWLLESNCGTSDIYKSIVGLFEHDEKIGLVFPQNYPLVRRGMPWTGLFRVSHDFCRKMGIKLNRFQKLDFPAGSMYWARPEALRPLLKLNLQWSDFAEEEMQTHGTLAHVIERTMCHICEAAGYRWIKVLSSDATPTGKVVIGESLADVKVHLKVNDFRLLKLNRARRSLGKA